MIRGGGVGGIIGSALSSLISPLGGTVAFVVVFIVFDLFVRVAAADLSFRSPAFIAAIIASFIVIGVVGGLGSFVVGGGTSEL